MNQPNYFEIQADDPTSAARFYTEVFGWEIFRDDAIPMEYYQIRTQGMNGGLLRRPAPKPEGEQGTNSYVCSMEVDDFDTTAEKIRVAGGAVALSKFAIPGRCWQGYFLDPDGNTFGIFQVDESSK